MAPIGFRLVSSRATGKKPSIPAQGYTWKTLPTFNKMIHEKYTKTSLTEAIHIF
ncbi:MAG: ClbS/DfsB family four-helix bundle protein [Bacteroidota bacterium]